MMVMQEMMRDPGVTVQTTIGYAMKSAQRREMSISVWRSKGGECVGASVGALVPEGAKMIGVATWVETRSSGYVEWRATA